MFSLKKEVINDFSEVDKIKFDQKTKGNIAKRRTDLLELDPNLALAAFQLRYLKGLILNLERRQVAETIAKVVGARRRDRS